MGLENGLSSGCELSKQSADPLKLARAVFLRL